MSLWRTERVGLYVGQSEVALARERRGADDGQASVDGGDWTASVAALSGLLERCDVRNGSAELRLGGPLAQALIVPWQAQLPGRQDREDYALHLYAKTFGETPGPLDVALGDADYGQAAPAFFVERALIEALRATLALRGVTLRVVEPLLVAAFNRFRRTFADTGAAVLVVTEPRCVHVALFQAGAWTAIRSRRVTADADDIAQVLRREITTLPAQAERVHLLAHASLAGLDEIAGIPVSRLRLARSAAPGFALLQ